MMFKTIMLDGREYTIHSPSFAALAQMKNDGYDLTRLPMSFDAGFVNSMVAACLTDLEPRENGTKKRMWTADEVGDMLAPDENGRMVYSAAVDLGWDVLYGIIPHLREGIEGVAAKKYANLGEALVALSKDDDAVPPAKTSQPKSSTGSEVPSPQPDSSTNTSD
jgi:hypothetical protein